MSTTELARPLIVSLLLLVSALFSGRSSATETAFVHRATSGNTFLFLTEIDHPALNDRPDAIFVVIHNWNPEGGLGGIDNDAVAGVQYSSTSGRWQILNEGFEAIAEGAAFNVFLPGGETTALVHTSTAQSTSGGDFTVIGDPATDDEPNALVFVTHLRTAASGGFHDHPLLVKTVFDTDLGIERWAIANQDGATMTEGVSFHVLVVPLTQSNAFLHETTVDNTSSEFSRLDSSLTNGQPEVRVMVTQREDFLGNENPHPVGVLYALVPSRWTIFNEDDASLPLGATFSVLVDATVFADGFESGTTAPWSSSVP